MIIHDAQFVISNTDVAKCPRPDKPEYAFIGRSNVGKSSLINMLTGRNNLAKISGKPGKTRLINHFLINNQWYLVDLPGYGFARVPLTERRKWEQFIRTYLLKRENLFCVFVLVDSRHEPQQNDLDFLSWLGKNGIPLAIVFTKTDKLNKAQMESFRAAYEEKLNVYWEELPALFVTSAQNRQGRDEILNFIESVNIQNSPHRE
ncbi:MAG TPA: ribosome biogenesis GTP-binding protein YihA/YsxC [Prolixibacteraceae bacterium]|nr:ribosome biogenesis GTP-binding protein YihA/YsxC [Prolixibacteraceae bacterium]